MSFIVFYGSFLCCVLSSVSAAIKAYASSVNFGLNA